MKNRDSLAFSLLEVMVAMAVLIVAIMGVLAALLASSQTQSHTRETEAAVRIINRQIAILQEMGYDAVRSDTGLKEFKDLVAKPLTGTGTERYDHFNETVFRSAGGGTRIEKAEYQLLTEAEATTLIPVDMDLDGTIDPTVDKYDLDRDGTAGEASGFGSGADQSDNTNYYLAPVRLRIWWKTKDKTRKIEFYTILYPKITS